VLEAPVDVVVVGVEVDDEGVLVEVEEEVDVEVEVEVDVDELTEAMVTEYVLVAVVELESVTMAVKVYVEAVVGVPAIAPAELSDRPSGRLPLVSAKVYEPEPPVADNVLE
jgi:hypothetical protein